MLLLRVQILKVLKGEFADFTYSIKVCLRDSCMKRVIENTWSFTISYLSDII